MGDLCKVPLSQIRENKVALRSVNRESEDYLGLVESIRQRGFFGAITVRQRKDVETDESYYELIDGLHRLSAAKDAGLDEISVDVTDLDDAAVLEAQLMANVHRVETKPAEYSKQLRRILAGNPYMTEGDLASKLGKSPSWIADRLSLNKIADEKIRALIDEGKINLTNAYALAKLPPADQADFLDRAMTESPSVFSPAVNQRVKEIREAHKKGVEENPPTFEPVAHMQKLAEIKAAVENGKVGATLSKKYNLTSSEQGFAMALKWVLHLDPESINAQKALWEQRQREKASKKEAAKVARKEKRAEEAKKKAEEAAKEAAEAKNRAEDSK